MKSIVVRDADGKVRVLTSEAFRYEEVLQNRIAEIPTLIPLAEVTDQDVDHVTIGHEWPAGTGAADVVLLGSDAVMTIVETKLKRNPESRREVIAQVLEYAAYVSEWTIIDVAKHAGDFFKTANAAPETANKTFDEVIAGLLEETDQTVESFKASIEQNLRQKRIRLIVAVDEVGEQAQKIITFINSYSSFDIYLLQISAYPDKDGRQIFVPALHGYARKVPTTRQRIDWDWDKFGSELRWTAEQIDLARTLNARLERVSSSWHPEVKFNHGWTTFYIGGKSAFGVTKSKPRGVELWFRLQQRPEGLPAGVRVHTHNKGYVYLGGNLSGIDDAALREVCKLAVDSVGVDVD